MLRKRHADYKSNRKKKDTRFKVVVAVLETLKILILQEIVDKCSGCDCNCSRVAVSETPKTLML